jgi:hypothetical protein
MPKSQVSAFAQRLSQSKLSPKISLLSQWHFPSLHDPTVFGTMTAPQHQLTYLMALRIPQMILRATSHPTSSGAHSEVYVKVSVELAKLCVKNLTNRTTPKACSACSSDARSQYRRKVLSRRDYGQAWAQLCESRSQKKSGSADRELGISFSPRSIPCDSIGRFTFLAVTCLDYRMVMRSTSRVVPGLPSDPPLEKKKEEEDDVLHFIKWQPNARGFRRNPRHKRRALRALTREDYTRDVFARSAPSQDTELAARPGEFPSTDDW